MNLKFPLRRTAAVAAGALIGLSGVVALAGPASAHHPEILSGTSCVNKDGSWEVTWTIENSEYDLVGKITAVEVTPAGSTIDGIAPEDSLPRRAREGSPRRAEDVITAVQTLGAADTAATIQVSAEWQRDKTITSTRTSNPIQKSDEVCKPKPTGTPSAPTDQPSTPTDQPSTPTDNPSTPTDNPSTPTDNPSTPAKPTKEPEFVYDETCDTVTVGITVPKDWEEDITVDFVTSEGDKKTVIGKRGETTTVEFPAVDGMKITATPKGYEGEDATITYEQPEDCNAGSGGGEEPSLPLTGAAAGSIAGGAAVLLAVGAGLFFMARRRKVKFTA
ncbi:LPXTG cell wall anchor domain-containing protein [Amorphoplanes digitatis]|uniref:LPXTG-motif cell wall-anchored protein n=1 Tax=Actinoplanes digitatis TaxID=1868 RepID=A0A7W7HTB3_9ACTN|nr:LPXTG cell wall anchor domain-containing protein [Actinoplanes digitatis]MBB4760323.1 LPXTG-motif cell wall-anchored protein [Actinoplanes digitatis]BFE68432.1 hypothetical protein GCM10020092_017330 [Actinoplanes digitatis]GID97494.1 hypothetical protein Adi01nite_69060 [Actinoplanes digitatis]